MHPHSRLMWIIIIILESSLSLIFKQLYVLGVYHCPHELSRPGVGLHYNLGPKTPDNHLFMDPTLGLKIGPKQTRNNVFRNLMLFMNAFKC